eukprot:CAMPEP_0197028906 /NCGR_PEP_ID=MMETSP1384-20130603/8487_1 /TAXON_ID=29189 /ORGANISM="Ammonia sp." /LENGTH=579 /DNA_ID=CAMNT_0042457987 /DNA_START=24 /DNA_END=1763 /DNA_ORIENTATION=+
MSNKSRKIGIYWFRKALRLHDNPSLIRACNECDIVYPLFFLDPAFTTKADKNSDATAPPATGASLPSKNVFKFFFETLADLNKSLKKAPFNSSLVVIRGNPTILYPKIFALLSITDLYFESDTEPYAKQRDNTVFDLCNQHKVKLHTEYGHTLYPPDFLIHVVQNKMNKEVPTTYRSFLCLLQNAKDPQKPMDAPSNIPGGEFVKQLLKNTSFLTEIASISGMNQHNFAVPALSELCYEEEFKTDKVNAYEVDDEQVHKYTLFEGGESNALQTMQQYLADKSWICKFEKPNTSPNSLYPSTTTLSMYLTTGSLSVRLLWHEIDKTYKQSKSGYSKPPTSLHGQLYFREWFYLLSFVTPNFHQMHANPICKQIAWDKYDADKVQKWRLGRTGYPFIDAIMIQLRRTGWIHHLARHAVACFLTRGDLWQSWEVGQTVFAEYLLDGDYALNAANWMWLSASAFFTAYFRVYSPIAFGKRTDKEGEFIKHWIPALKHYPAKYIYEPWTAPKELQKQWGCVIGVDYPAPMVDHDEVKQANLAKMKQAFEANRGEKKSKKKSKVDKSSTSNTAVSGKKRKRNEME